MHSLLLMVESVLYQPISCSPVVEYVSVCVVACLLANNADIKSPALWQDGHMAHDGKQVSL